MDRSDEREGRNSTAQIMADAAPNDGGTDWALFYRSVFIKTALELWQPLADVAGAFLAECAAGDRPVVRLSLYGAGVPFGQHLDLLSNAMGTAPEVRAAALRRFFPPGARVGGAPPTLWPRTCFFKYSTTRIQWREKWRWPPACPVSGASGAFHPALLPPQSDLESNPNWAVPDAALETCDEFNNCFFAILVIAIRALAILVPRSLPARKRVAEDTILLDALFWNIILPANEMPFFFGDTLPQITTKEAEEMETYFGLFYHILRGVLLTNSKPYKKHIESPSGSMAFTWFRNRWSAALRRYMPFNAFVSTAPALRKTLSEMAVFYSEIVAAFGPFTLDEPNALVGVLKSTRKEQKLQRANMFASPDTCDFCGRIPDDGRRRCSKCLFARYCGPECQKEAWTKSRKDGTPWYGGLGQKPHKMVCFDARTDDVVLLVGKG